MEEGGAPTQGRKSSKSQTKKGVGTLMTEKKKTLIWKGRKGIRIFDAGKKGRGSTYGSTVLKLG